MKKNARKIIYYIKRKVDSKEIEEYMSLILCLWWGKK